MMALCEIIIILLLRNASIFDQDCERIKRRSCGVAIHITATTMATICPEKSNSVVISVKRASREKP